MSDVCATLKVQPWGHGQGEFVEINASDYDPAVHVLIDGEVAPGSNEPASTDIPDDWQSLHWKSLVKLAKDNGAAEDVDYDGAKAFVADLVARRAAPDAE